MKKTLASLLIMLSSTTTFAAYNNMLFQAGSIEEGKQVTITKDSGIASYFQDGTTGYVTFNCTLTPSNSDEKVTAYLYPGKNFQNSQNPFFVEMNAGVNGPYVWHLSNEGDNTGNIRIRLKTDSIALLQCHGTYTPDETTITH